MRVEQALRLLPNLEALMPLRGLLLSSARPDERVQWGSGGPYLTVGKRDVEPGELARSMGPVLAGVAEHITALYKAYVEALEGQERKDAPGAVTALVGAGRLEEKVGRLSQAQAWYAVALTLAEALQERRPEIDTLLAIGHVCLALGEYAEGARYYQRALVLSEAASGRGGRVGGTGQRGVRARRMGRRARVVFARPAAHRSRKRSTAAGADHAPPRPARPPPGRLGGGR